MWKCKRGRVEELFTTMEKLPAKTSPERATSRIVGRWSVAFLADVSLDDGVITCLLAGLYTEPELMQSGLPSASDILSCFEISSRLLFERTGRDLVTR